jgi:hypothetical protein
LDLVNGNNRIYPSKGSTMDKVNGHEMVQGHSEYPIVKVDTVIDSDQTHPSSVRSFIVTEKNDISVPKVTLVENAGTLAKNLYAAILAAGENSSQIVLFDSCPGKSIQVEYESLGGRSGRYSKKKKSQKTVNGNSRQSIVNNGKNSWPSPKKRKGK